MKNNENNEHLTDKSELKSDDFKNENVKENTENHESPDLQNESTSEKEETIDDAELKQDPVAAKKTDQEYLHSVNDVTNDESEKPSPEEDPPVEDDENKESTAAAVVPDNTAVESRETESIEKNNSEELKDAQDESEAHTNKTVDSDQTDTDNEIEEVPDTQETTDKGNDADGATDQKEEHKETSDKSASKEEPKEKVEYELLSRNDLVLHMEELLNQKSIGGNENEVNEVYDIFQKKRDVEIEEKKKNFLASGGLEQDFKPVEDPSDVKMDELMERFRSLKSEHNKQLEIIKNENLAEKNEILEQFRILMESPESFDLTFRKFKQLQKRWFDIGIVPKQNVKDLWNTYNFFVDKFNDYVNINKELRQLDYKKNLDQKLQLCEKAEDLLKEKNIVSAFRMLQKFHSQWREIGPVPLENKDEIWQRFKKATSAINKAHQEYQSQLKESLVHNLEKKTLLCEKVEELAGLELDSHKKWSEKTNELLAIQKEWKTIGYAPKKVNNQIYSRFRKACDAFFDKKAEFYARNFAEQNDNLEAKKAIVTEAETLKDSTDWKVSTDKLINLQKKWKNIGPVPRKDSDRLWKQFRAACDHFFTEKSNFFSGNDESHEDNLKLKKELIQKVKAENPGDSIGSLRKILQKYQVEYDEIGFVPIEMKDTIRDEYRQAIDELIDRAELSDADKMSFRYRTKILGILHGPRADSKINFERDKLIAKLQQLQNDIGVWENNIGFFKETKSSEGTISDFQKKLDDAKDRIYVLEKKIDIIDELDPN